LVEPAPRGRQPTWGGYIPQFLGFDLCQKILEILTSDTPHPVCDPDAAAVLEQHRREMQEVVAPRVGGMEIEGDEIRWWTFAGGRINSTLRYALLAVGGDWKVVTDNFLIKMSGDDLTQRAFFDTLDKIKDPSTWDDDRLWHEVADSLPNYRLSKFQALMPEWVQREVVSTYLLDIDGARGWLVTQVTRDEGEMNG
jgi:ATP-dependent Lhr-like helicase